MMLVGKKAAEDGFARVNALMCVCVLLQVLISDCIGVHWVGFCLTMFGVGSALSAFIGGRLVKCIPQYVVIYFISALNAALLLFLLIWPKHPTYYVPFLILLGLGACEGTWNSMGASKCCWS